MNIEFGFLTKQHKYLEDLEDGAIFQPINSQRIFMILNKTSGSEIFSNSDSRLLTYWENLQNNVFENYDNLIACAELANGRLLFLHAEDKVIELNHKLIIES